MTIKLQNQFDTVIALYKEDKPAYLRQKRELLLKLVKQYVPSKIKDEIGTEFETNLEEFLTIVVLKQYSPAFVKDQLDRLPDN